MNECKKLEKCGHCACYSDLDYDFPGCQWCAVLKENEDRSALLLQLSEVTAHRDRLRDMMNDVRGLLLCPPADLEVQIMRRIEDGAITEKRNHEHGPQGPVEGPGSANE